MSPSAPIQVRHRQTGEVFEERVLGRKALDWTYSTASGRIFLAAIGRHAWFSALYGAYLKSRWSRSKVESFARDFGIDLTEAVVPPGGFSTFNDFFIRKLRPGARPMPPDTRCAVLPADGRHLAYANESQAEGFVVKGQRFTLESLLSDSHLARAFAGGTLLISRLCPVDYHRFHFPVAGRAGAARCINGPLFSVSPIALRRHVGYLAENKRMVTTVESEPFGCVALVEVGATMVGAIQQTFTAATDVQRGQEKGYFEFGGSCCITLFQKGRIRLCEDLQSASAQHLETFARMGEPLGVACS